MGFDTIEINLVLLNFCPVGVTLVADMPPGGHPIYTILSVSILKKMLDGFYMKIMDLTIQ